MRKYLLICIVILFSNSLLAQTTSETESTTTETSATPTTPVGPTPNEAPPVGTPTKGPEGWKFGAVVNTSAPTFTGAGLMLLGPRSSFSLQAGYMPPYYRTLIGRAIAYFSNNPPLQGIIEDVFEKNRMMRGDFTYRFSEESSWHIGASFMSLTSSGRADVDEALSAATGQDFSDLKTVLDALGMEAKIDVDSDFLFMEAYTGYGWIVNEHLYMDFSLGLMKILSAKVSVDTGLDDLESIPPIRQAISGAERDLEDDIVRNGLSPIISIRAAYLF